MKKKLIKVLSGWVGRGGRGGLADGADGNWDPGLCSIFDVIDTFSLYY